MSNLKNISELPIAEPSEGLNLIVNDNGNAKQIPIGSVVVENSGGGGGGVFVIDTTSVDYSLVNTTYGNSIKDALLSGKTVYFYDGANYFTVTAFKIQTSTASSPTLLLYISGSVSTSGGISFTPKLYTFNITL